jgi:hypothetical protein
MMNLSEAQIQALSRGETVKTTIEGVSCVLMTEEVYRRVQKDAYDASPLTQPEEDEAFLEAGEIAGWDDHALDVYNELDPRK